MVRFLLPGRIAGERTGVLLAGLVSNEISELLVGGR